MLLAQELPRSIGLQADENQPASNIAAPAKAVTFEHF